jgi:hypothetical protein
MRRARLSEFGPDALAPHVLASLVPGRRLYRGGLSWHKPNHVSHADERPHVEVDHEVFVLLQGEGWIEINGVRESAQAGEVIIIEPGEDHHLISSAHNPFVNLWLHADERGHPDQSPLPDGASSPPPLESLDMTSNLN